MARSYRFGSFEVRPIERRLLGHGEEVAVGSRAFDVLLSLIEARHRVVTKDELLDLAWPGLVVEENNLQAQVSALRRILGHHAIATIPGLGYRFAVPIEDDDEAATIDRVPRSRLTNLPAATEGLIGRDRDLRELACLARAHRLVTVLGTGGIGKSRLAKEAARVLVHEFPDGVWHADLSAAQSPAEIATAIAAAAGLALGHGDACVRLDALLEGKNLLIVMDNCERLADAAASVAAGILASAPAVRVIATSQDAFKVAGEHLYRLGTLEVPPPDSALAEARHCGAVAMLERRVRAIDGRFRLTQSNLPAAIGICRQLDGIALAIEMAAARVPVMGLEALNAQLGESLRTLCSNERDAPAHHRTMQAMLDWSDAGLRPEERRALDNLASFAGSFSLECALEAIGEPPAGDALDILGSLVQKSRVQVENTQPPRYRLLETTRRHLLDRMASDDERRSAFERHGRIMAGLALEIAAGYWTLNRDEWLRRHRPDYEDLRASFSRAHDRGDPETAGAAIEALRWLDFECDSPYSMRPRIGMIKDLLPAASLLARARLLNGLTTFRRLPLDGLVPLDVARERVAAWRALGDRRQLYLALIRLATYSAYAGDFGESDRALAEAGALEDRNIPARMLAIHADNAASIGWVRGNASMVSAYACKLQALAPRIGGERTATLVRFHFAEALMLEGNPLQAAALLREVAGHLAAMEMPALEGHARALMCGALLSAGRVADAREAAVLALPLVIRNGNPDPLLEHVGTIAALDGCPLEAAQLLGFLGGQRRDGGVIRPPANERLAKDAQAAIDRALDRAEQQRLGQAGARLEMDQVVALASVVLD